MTRSVLLEAFVVGLVGSTVGLALGVRAGDAACKRCSARSASTSARPALVFEPRTVLVAAYAVGVVVTLAGRVPAGPPAPRGSRRSRRMRDDVAHPGVVDAPAAGRRRLR